MKKTAVLVTIAMLCTAASVCSQTVWLRPDSLLQLPCSENISCTEEYSIVAVLKSLEPDSTQLLWGVRSDDTLRSAFLTNGSFRERGGVYCSQQKRDYSKWCVCYYHTGCRMDTMQSHQLWLGPSKVYYTDSVSHADSLEANVSIRELLYVSGRFSRWEAASWQSYMAMKYGITLDYAPYLSSSGDTLWHHEQDADYYHRIVAIGTDSLHKWSATCSASLENASMLIQTMDSLAEGEYLLLGDNGMDEAWSMLPDGRDGLVRSWRLRQHTASPQDVTLVWHPTLLVAQPDSVRLLISDEDGHALSCVAADSVVGDTAYWFSCHLAQEVMHLRIVSAESKDAELSAEVTYDASSGTLSIPFLDPDKTYNYAFYTQVGQLLFRPAPSPPNSVSVGVLPPGVYRIEAFDGNRIVASRPVIIH